MPSPTPAQTTPAAPADKPTEIPPAHVAGERDPAEFMSDIASELGDIDSGKTPAQSAPRDDKGKFTKPADKQADKKPADKIEKPDDKPEDKPEAKPDDKPADKPGEIKPTKAADLRAAYDGLKKKVKEELDPEIQRLRSRVTELESRKPEESAPIIEKLKALEARNAELEKHIEYIDFSESKEFKTKYADPYNEAWQDAVSEFKELTVRERDGEDEADDPKYATRVADENDLLKLANMRLSDMDAAATEMFGPSAARAIGHVQQLRKLYAAKQKALDEAKNKAGEWKSQRTLEQQQKTQSIGKAWEEVNKALEAKFPKAFKADEADPDDKAALTKGFAMADLMFLGPKRLTPDQVEALPESFKAAVKADKLTDEHRVQLHSIARLKAANHDRQVARVKKLTARVAELEKSLAEYEQSAPPAGNASQSDATITKSWDEQALDELKALDK